MHFASKALIGATFAVISGSALAADLPYRTKAPAPVPMIASWTGFYVGATTGYNFFTNTSSLVRPNGASIGIRAGYDHQIAPTFVLGVLAEGELDFGSKSFSGAYLGTPYTGSLKHRYTASLDLRAGYLLNDQTMIYVLGGYTNGQLKASATVAAVSAQQSWTGNGWNVGAGVEYRFTQSWSGFVEYRYNQLKKSGSTANVSQVKLGVAYRF